MVRLLYLFNRCRTRLRASFLSVRGTLLWALQRHLPLTQSATLRAQAGAVLFGRLGDRAGRKPALVATMLLMGFATVLTGFLPTFETVGALAPVLLVLLRFVQGVAVGGEWGGAVLISVEHAPEKSKTLFGSFAQLGNPTGAMLATGVFAVISSFGDEALLTWGWRIPFVLSAVLIAVGFIVRTRVEESPEFVQTKTVKVPSQTRTGVLAQWPRILLGIGLVAVPSGAYYISSTYFTAFATGESVGIDTTLVLQILTVGSFCELIATVPIAWVGDRLGRVKVFMASCAALGIFGIPLFLFTSHANIAGVVISMIIIRLAGSGAYSALAAIMSQSLPNSISVHEHVTLVPSGRCHFRRPFTSRVHATVRCDRNNLVCDRAYVGILHDFNCVLGQATGSMLIFCILTRLNNRRHQ